jgi:hypothetical protein
MRPLKRKAGPRRVNKKRPHCPRMNYPPDTPTQRRRMRKRRWGTLGRMKMKKRSWKMLRLIRMTMVVKR